MSQRTPFLTGTIPNDQAIRALAAVDVDGDLVLVCATGYSTI